MRFHWQLRNTYSNVRVIVDSFFHPGKMLLYDVKALDEMRSETRSD